MAWIKDKVTFNSYHIPENDLDIWHEYTPRHGNVHKILYIPLNILISLADHPFIVVKFNINIRIGQHNQHTWNDLSIIISAIGWTKFEKY